MLPDQGDEWSGGVRRAVLFRVSDQAKPSPIYGDGPWWAHAAIRLSHQLHWFAAQLNARAEGRVKIEWPASGDANVTDEREPTVESRP